MCMTETGQKYRKRSVRYQFLVNTIAMQIATLIQALQLEVRKIPLLYKRSAFFYVSLKLSLIKIVFTFLWNFS